MPADLKRKAEELYLYFCNVFECPSKFPLLISCFSLIPVTQSAFYLNVTDYRVSIFVLI